MISVPVPAMADELAALFHDATPGEVAATDAIVATFIAQHTAATRPDLVSAWLKGMCGKIAAGESRHQTATGITTGAAKEVFAGLISAAPTFDALRTAFVAAVMRDPSSAKQGAARTREQAVSEWAGILSWAVAQALASDPDETRRAAAERLFDAFAWVTDLAREADELAPDQWAQRYGEPWAQQYGALLPTVGAALDPAPIAGEVVDERPAMAAAVLSRSDLRNLPAPEPLISNVLDRGTCALLYGYRGSYKSFVAFDWAACVATGKPWQGRQVSMARGLYIAAEGAIGYQGRSNAWEVGWGRKIDDGTLDFYPRPVNFMDARQVAELGALVAWGGYGFIVIDTVARCSVGADENSAKDAGLFIDRMYWILNRTPGGRGVVLAVHHTGKDKTTLRGSSAFDAGVDTVYAATRDEGAVLLNREKRKDGPELDAHELRLDLIQGTNSAVLSVHQQVDKPERASRLLSTFVHLFLTTGATKSELRNVADMPNATFHRALDDLVKSGELINTGTDKRPFYKAAQQ